MDEHKKVEKDNDERLAEAIVAISDWIKQNRAYIPLSVNVTYALFLAALKKRIRKILKRVKEQRYGTDG